MKTIILYATKSGATSEIARRIAAKIDGAEVYDLKGQNIPDLNKYDSVIIGSPVYAGTVRKEVKVFLAEKSGLLTGKRLGLFVSGMYAKGEKEYFESNFSPDILQMSTTYSFLGGIFDPKKTGVVGRLIMKAATKQSGYLENILSDKLEAFVQAMTS